MVPLSQPKRSTKPNRLVPWFGVFFIILFSDFKQISSPCDGAATFGIQAMLMRVTNLSEDCFSREGSFYERDQFYEIGFFIGILNDQRRTGVLQGTYFHESVSNAWIQI